MPLRAEIFRGFKRSSPGVNFITISTAAMLRSVCKTASEIAMRAAITGETFDPVSYEFLRITAIFYSEPRSNDRVKYGGYFIVQLLHPAENEGLWPY
jgi:hypothetical protein